MNKKTITAVLALLACSALVLPLHILQGCAGKEKVDSRIREYVEEELSTMLDLMFDVEDMDPVIWIEDIYPKDNQWDMEAVGIRIRHALEVYERVQEYMNICENRDISQEVYYELYKIRGYLGMGVNYIKIAIELLNMDMEEKSNKHMDLVYEISNNFDNTYPRYFFDEYNRIAEKYGLPKRGE